jgi:serine/threonine protein kinase
MFKHLNMWKLSLSGTLPPPRERHVLIAERYEVLEQLGEGAFGVVYRCQDHKLDRLVALKRLKGLEKPEVRERFLREGRLASRVDHPHVVRVLDQGLTEEGAPYLVSEFIEGRTLAERLAEREPLAIGQAHIWLQHLLEALAAVHEVGIAHRDIKPANVLIAPDGVRLTDFGLADATSEDALTATGHVVGTPAYLAPECLRETRPNEQSDLWALGAVGYELFYRRRWRGKLDATLLREEQRRPPEPDPERFGHFPEVDRVLAHLLAGDPAARPPSAEAALTALMGEDEHPLLPQRSPATRRGPLLAVASLGFLLGATWLTTRPSPPATPSPPVTPSPPPALEDETPKLRKARKALAIAYVEPDSNGNASGGSRTQQILALCTEPAAPLRWRRFLDAVLEAERSRPHPPPPGWLMKSAAASLKVAKRFRNLDIDLQEIVLQQALGAELPEGAGAWRERREEFLEMIRRALEELDEGERPPPSEGFLATVFHLGLLAPLPAPERRVAEAENLLAHPGSDELVLALCRYLQEPSDPGPGFRSLSERTFQRLVDWLDAQPEDSPSRGGPLQSLAILAARVLRRQHPTPLPETLERFDHLVQELAARGEASEESSITALQKVHTEMGRESVVGALDSTTPESWEPFLVRRRRIRAMVELLSS